MKYYIIAGEASGDMHGANLINEIKKTNGEAKFRCWGGNKMIDTGASIVKHINELAFMGFIEVLKNIRTINNNLNYCKQDILNYKPDIIIYIDYPGFNMRIAKWAKQYNFKNIYYISPQIWAWKQNRVYAIKKYIDLMLVILPFEKAFYKKFNVNVTYVGHPLLDELKKITPIIKKDNVKKIVALLPGSRKQEIDKMLLTMLAVANQFKEVDFVLAAAPTLPETYYKNLLLNIDTKNIQFEYNNTYSILQKADAAIVTSGTATLETALLNVPQVVCYKTSNVSYWIAKRIVKIQYISLVNLILDNEVVKELIQQQMTVNNIVKELKNLLHNTLYINKFKNEYSRLSQLLGKDEGASKKAAQEIANFLKQNIK